MMTDAFSAAPQSLGYLYQVRYALFLALLADDAATLTLETADDLTFEKGNNSHELLQLKHHTNPANLTNLSPDLWKTLRVWTERVKTGLISAARARFVLVTTAAALPGTAASLLKTGPNRDPIEAERLLSQSARSSTNKDLSAAINAFLELDATARIAMLTSAYVVDLSDNIVDVRTRLLETVRHTVRAEHRHQLLERLEGWWFDRAVRMLTRDETSIAIRDVTDKVQAIAEQFRPEALPIDFLDYEPAEAPSVEDDSRPFIRQLKSIGVHSGRIEKAILDYYRAFEQRSRWAREDLLFTGEITSYEKRLTDEWERFSLAVCQDLDRDTAENVLQDMGRQIYNWMELKADIRIRRDVSEPYVMRGSYHMLADDHRPRVWWHPRFVERMGTLISDSSTRP